MRVSAEKVSRIGFYFMCLAGIFTAAVYGAEYSGSPKDLELEKFIGGLCTGAGLGVWLGARPFIGR